jgi:hypothetical protein
LVLWTLGERYKVRPKNATAIPKTTHKNTGVADITAVIVKKAATIPTIKLAKRATPTQLTLLSQLNKDIFFTSLISIYD